MSEAKKEVVKKVLYHPEKEVLVVESGGAEEESAKKLGYVESPAEYGVETQPGLKPDPVIAKKAAELAAKKAKSEKGKEA